MALSDAKLIQVRDLRTERDAARARLLDEKNYMGVAEREAEKARMVELTGQIMQIEESANPQPARFPEVVARLDISPAEAKAKAHAIRSNPAFWSPDKLNPATRLPALTPAQHGELVREVTALDARANQEEP